ncbi:peptidase M48 [Haloterrigena sp. H1]|uniref:M48 family metallopeptidase n=1 Tax=Haloterrigena sp. H1 TaxID=2552943 RepID=UPI00110F458C|nr:M48 family metalloprotease [Haloterrigena sp. H1]TMT81448.1 peptidase M48 [Haloterrigena sp. H1]
MSLSPDRQLQVRIAGALALVVGVNVIVLSVLVWSGLHVVSASKWSLPTEVGFPLTVGAVLLGAVGLVALQGRYGSQKAVGRLCLNEFDRGGPRNVTGRVQRLATQANVPAPSVAVADRVEPGCLTVGTQRSPTIVVTTGLLEQLDDDELDAALAHEVAHIANRDLPVATAVAATVALGDQLLGRERLLRRVLENTVMIGIFTGVGIFILAIPILVLGLAYLVVSLVARGLLGVNAIALGLFSKTREFAADRGASQLTGDPSAVASALETLEDERPKRDARLHASATLGIVPRPLLLDEEEDDEEHWIERYLPAVSIEGPEDPSGLNRGLVWLYARLVSPVIAEVRRMLSWRPSTHPATETRIDQLRALERDRRK